MANLLNVILRITGQNNAGGALLGLNQGLMLAEAAVDALNQTVGEFIRQGIQMNSFLETSELQFKTLTGSAQAAHEQVAMLFDLAAHTPFTFESVTVASRQLEVFGGAVLDTRDNLVLMGDAAAATGAPIEQVTFWTGRLYSALQAGEPIGMATLWLQRMGVLSAEATRRMQELSDQGASADEIWTAFTGSMQRFSGAMKEQEGTWKGLTSTMSDTFTLLEGATTKGLFTTLESQLKGVNAALASPQAAQDAFVAGEALNALAAAGERLATTFANSPVFTLYAAGLDAVTDAEKRAWAASLELSSAGERLASVMEAGVGKAANLSDATGNIAVVMEAGAGAGVRLIAVYDTLAGSYETLAAAERQRLYDQGQALANAGSQEQIIFNARLAMEQNVAAAEERNRQQAERNRQADFQAQAAAITAQNQETQRQIVEQTRAAQEAVRRAYVGTADEADAQYRRIAMASQGVADSFSDMQQQLDEATNRQVRAGTAGSAAAAQELEDIRRRYLALIPDLAALDNELTAARVQQRTADLALAAAQRTLAVALAAAGGQQTLQTAALAHNVTAAQAAAQAALDHANALAQERGQAISLTNALGNLSAAQGGGGGGLLLQDTGSQAHRTRFYGMPLVHATVVNIDQRGATVGVDNLQRTITDTVNSGIRTGSVQVSGLGAR